MSLLDNPGRVNDSTNGRFISYLIMPTISKIPFEAHPFTLANMSGIECPQGEATFVIRARDGQSNMPALVG